MKILYVNVKANIGGIETLLMNIIRNMDLVNNEVSFLLYDENKNDYEDELQKLGCKIIKISPKKKVSNLQHLNELIDFFKNNHFDVVHCNTYFDSAYVLYAAKKAHVKVRISHSHTSESLTVRKITKKIKWFIARTIINNCATNRLACSSIAGKALFGNKKFTIIENGVDVDKYSFSKEKRELIRSKYKLSDNNIVVGHVGRLAPVKNHTFLIDTFKELYNLNSNYRLMIIGDGPEKSNIEAYINSCGLSDVIIMTGNISNTADYYNALDLIVFPSLYEGLPFTLVESQINGLKIFASDTVSNESNFTNTIDFISLKKSAKEWASLIINYSINRFNNYELAINSPYNIKNTVKKLMKIYEGKNDGGR